MDSKQEGLQGVCWGWYFFRGASTPGVCNLLQLTPDTCEGELSAVPNGHSGCSPSPRPPVPATSPCPDPFSPGLRLFPLQPLAGAVWHPLGLTFPYPCSRCSRPRPQVSPIHRGHPGPLAPSPLSELVSMGALLLH